MVLHDENKIKESEVKYEKIIKVNNLVKNYGSFEAVKKYPLM